MESIHKSAFAKWRFGLQYLRSVCGLFLMALFIAAVYLRRDTKMIQEDLQIQDDDVLKHCNIFSGKWVYDDKSSPAYTDQKCSFMIVDYACQKHGRKDTKYQRWRWQPHECDLPRFNATKLLEKLRGKRVIFVGDSLNKNQWISFLCLIEPALPPSERFNEWQGSLITFHTSVYNVSIDFYWDPMLVESNCDDPIEHRVKERYIKFQKIEKHAKHWTDADVLVFDSFMWWLGQNMTLLWGSSDKSLEIYKEAGRARRYEMALRTWTDWLILHVNRTKTQMFFMSLSPYHQMGEDWGKGANTNCYNETEPIMDENYWGSGTERNMMVVAEEAVQRLGRNGLKIQYLNITELSDKRREGHPSIYKKQWKPPSKDELENPSSYSDCVHWCLPGVPDVWNHLLYTYILHYSSSF